jgi:hypothetical protein
VRRLPRGSGRGSVLGSWASSAPICESGGKGSSQRDGRGRYSQRHLPRRSSIAAMPNRRLGANARAGPWPAPSASLHACRPTSAVQRGEHEGCAGPDLKAEWDALRERKTARSKRKRSRSTEPPPLLPPGNGGTKSAERLGARQARSIPRRHGGGRRSSARCSNELAPEVSRHQDVSKRAFSNSTPAASTRPPSPSAELCLAKPASLTHQRSLSRRSICGRLCNAKRRRYASPVWSGSRDVFYSNTWVRLRPPLSPGLRITIDQ